jgi:hypothetical protein
MKLNLVTVVGNDITMLPHMINHYKDIVDEIFVVVYRQSEDDTILDDILRLGIKPYKVVVESKFNWERVTELYNEVKKTKPDEWWIVSDDDEFHIYPKPIREMIDECEKNGWEFITGGLLDRIGKSGTFPTVTNETDIWKEFPLGGFFRYPMSGGCPNKVCVMKGNIEVTGGQHYARINEEKVWRVEGIKHPLRYPIEKGFIQVHHFKWDSTCIERIKEVSETKENYTYWREFRDLFINLERNKFLVDINEKDYYIDSIDTYDYSDYKHWSELTQKIVEI